MMGRVVVCVALVALISACAQATPVPGRADNDLLRFSAIDYATLQEGAR